MKHGVTQTLYNYWDNLRGARPAPNRSEVDPGEIRGLLGDTFILETNGPKDVRYRLAGTRLCSAHCRELKGRNFLRGWSVKDREALESLLAAITEDAAAAVIGINGHTERGQILQMEMLLVPLNVPGEGRIRVLGSCTPMEKPYWIGLHPILSQSISSLRLVWPDERPYFVDFPCIDDQSDPAALHGRRPCHADPAPAERSGAQGRPSDCLFRRKVLIQTALPVRWFACLPKISGRLRISRPVIF